MTPLSFDIVARDLTGGGFASLESGLDRARRASELTSAAMQSGFAQATGEIMRTTAAVNANTAALGRNAVSTGALAQRSRQLSFQLIDIGQALATAPTMGIYALQNLGFQVAQIGQLYMGQGGFNQAIKDSARQVGAFAARLGPLAAVAGLVAAGIAGMRHEINRTSAVTVTFGDVALGVIHVIRDGLWNVVRPAVEALAPWFAAAWELIVDFSKFGINSLVGLFVGGFGAIKAVWKGLPAAIGETTVSAANTALSAINELVQRSVAAIDWLTDKINRIPGVNIPKLAGRFSIGGIDNPFAGALSGMAGEISAAFADARHDYAGDFFELVRGNAIQNAIVRTTDAARGANESLKALARQSLADIRAAADQTNRAVEAARERLADAANFVAGAFDRFFDGLRNGQSAWEALRETGLSVIEDLSRALLRSAILQLFTSGGAIVAPLHVGTPMFGEADFGLDGRLLPRAAGGDFRSGDWLLAGEEGPEIIKARGNGTVVPNHALGGAQQIRLAPVFNIHGGSLSPAEIAGQVEARLDHFVRYRLPELARHHAGTGLLERG